MVIELNGALHNEQKQRCSFLSIIHWKKGKKAHIIWSYLIKSYFYLIN